jgi:hypothetical protein
MDQIDPSGGGQSLYDDISELYRLRVEVAEQRQRIEYLQSALVALLKDGRSPPYPDFDGLAAWSSPTAPPRIFA